MSHRWVLVLVRTVPVVVAVLAGCQGGSGSKGSSGAADASMTPSTSGQGDDSGVMQTITEPGDAGASGDDGGPSSSCTDGGVGIPPLVDASACTPGTLAAGPMVTLVTPDQDPSNPVLASSPSGDRFLAVWTDGGYTIGSTTVPETIWVALVPQGSDADASSAAIELTGNGTCPVAAWNGTDFTVVWGDSSGLRSQEVDGTGALVGTPVQVLSKVNASACPASTVATPGGLAVAWYEGQSTYTENVGLIGQGGAIGSPLLLESLGPGVAANAGLAQVQGQTYVAYVQWLDANTSDTVVSGIDWAQGMAVSKSVEPGFLSSFIAAGDELFLTAGFAGSTLYGGTAGTSLQPIGELCTRWSIVSDGCGRLVQLGIGGVTPAGIAVGFFAQPLGWASPAVSFGNVTQGAIVGAASTFGLLWFARVGPGIPQFPDAQTSGTLSFTTLSWTTP